jgi:CheY-like chemotaxis protein
VQVIDDAPDAEASPEGRPATVLVIDDDAEWRSLLREALGQVGYRVLETARGDLALAAVERDRPDVLVLDHHMPGLDGLDLIAALRRRWPILPVVLTSAFGDPLIAERALRYQATRYLDKPFHITSLIAEISALAGGRKAR